MSFQSFKSAVIRQAHVNVLDYGADNTGSADNGPAFTAAAAALPTHGGTILCPPGVYKFDTSFTWPMWGGYATVDIHAEGARFETTNAIVMWDRWPASQTVAQNNALFKFRLHGGRFIGNSIHGQTALRLGASYGSVIEGALFQQFTNGVVLAFNLGLTMRNCHFTYAPLVLQAGTNAYTAAAGMWWTNATVANSQANHSRVENCRFFTITGQDFAVGIFDSSQISLEQCIFEGPNPKTDILFNSGWAALGGLRVVNTHLEHTPGDAFLRLEKLARSTVTLDRLVYPAATPLINATNCDQPIINVENVQYLDNVPAFDASARLAYPGSAADGRLVWQWNFRNCTGQAGNDFRDPKWWVGGVVPRNLTITGAGTEHGIGSQTFGNNPTNPAVRIVEDSHQITNLTSGAWMRTTNMVTTRTNGISGVLAASTTEGPGYLHTFGAFYPQHRTVVENFNYLNGNFYHLAYGALASLAFGPYGLIMGNGTLGDSVQLFIGTTNNPGTAVTYAQLPANALVSDYLAGSQRMRLRAKDGSAVTIAAGTFHATNTVVSSNFVGGAASLTNANAETLFGSGVVPAVRLGSGSVGDGSKTLLDNGTWGDLTGLGVTSFNGDVGAVTLSSTHINNALGFDPVDPSSLGTAAYSPSNSFLNPPPAYTDEQQYDQGSTYYLVAWDATSGGLKQVGTIRRDESSYAWIMDAQKMTNGNATLFFGSGQVPVQYLGTGSDGLGNMVLYDNGTWGPVSASGGVTSFNSRTGAVTLSGTDVNTALGYTAANANALQADKLTSGTIPLARMPTNVWVAPGNDSIVVATNWDAASKSHTFTLTTSAESQAYDVNVSALKTCAAATSTNIWTLDIGPGEVVMFDVHVTARAPGFVGVASFKDVWKRDSTANMERPGGVGGPYIGPNYAIEGFSDFVVDYDTANNRIAVRALSPDLTTNVLVTAKGHVVRNAGPP